MVIMQTLHELFAINCQKTWFFEPFFVSFSDEYKIRSSVRLIFAHVFRGFVLFIVYFTNSSLKHSFWRTTYHKLDKCICIPTCPKWYLDYTKFQAGVGIGVGKKYIDSDWIQQLHFQLHTLVVLQGWPHVSLSPKFKDSPITFYFYVSNYTLCQ